MFRGINLPFQEIVVFYPNVNFDAVATQNVIFLPRRNHTMLEFSWGEIEHPSEMRNPLWLLDFYPV